VAEFADGSLPTRELRKIEKSWRQYRTYSVPQRIAGDFLTNQGRFARRPSRIPFCLFGGAGWGGKSHWLRSMAFEICMVYRDLGFPNVWGALYCDTYPNLLARHIVKFEDEFAGIGTVQDSTKRGLHVKFHGEGMGGVYLKNVVSSSNLGAGKGSQRGAEAAFILIDELTEFEQDQYAAIIYQARWGSDLPFFPRAHGTNPDGIGHGWVKRIFVPQYRDLEDPIFQAVGPENFLYVPAKKENNPAYTAMGDVINANMAMIKDPDVRRAREEGDWDLYANGRFWMWTEKLHTFRWEDLFHKFSIPTELTPLDFLRTCRRYGFEIWGSLDYGTSERSASAYYLHLVDPNGHPWTFGELIMVGDELEDQAVQIKDFERGLEIQGRYADPSIGGTTAEREDQRTRQERFGDEGLWFELGVRDRVEGASTIASLLYYERDDLGSIKRYPKWRVLKKYDGDAGFGCKDLITMIPELPRDKHNPEDVDKRDGKNHPYDSVRYFLHTRYSGGSAQEEPIAMYSAAWYRAVAEVNRRPNVRPSDRPW
jgi:hypothetical protein